MRFSYSKPNEISRGLKRIWESKMGTPYSARIIQDVDLALKASESVYREMGLQLRVWLIGMDTYENWQVKG